MKESKKTKDRWLHLRLSEEEQSCLQKLFHDSTTDRMSEYARQVLLARPVYKGYVDTGQQHILGALTGLKKEMNGIGTNFNQLVRRLHTMPGEELKDTLLAYESEHAQLLKKIEEIHALILKLGLQWLQK